MIRRLLTIGLLFFARGAWTDDIRPGQVFDCVAEAPPFGGATLTTWAGSPAFKVQRVDTATSTTTGVTFSSDSCGTGCNRVEVDTSTDATFYAAGHNYSVCATAGNNGSGWTLTGLCFCDFSISNRAVVADSSGRVDLGKWLGSAPNALQSGRVDSYVGAMATDSLTAAAVSAGAVTKIAAGFSATDPWSVTVPGSYGSGTAGFRMQYLDALISSRGTSNLSAANLTVISPTASTGNVTVIIGDDYNAADTGREIAWTSTGWPDLTGATITFAARSMGPTSTLTTAGSVVTPTGTAKVRVNLTAAQTGALISGDYSFDVAATLSSGRVVTLVRATLRAVSN